jgi:hypothetical protein
MRLHIQRQEAPRSPPERSTTKAAMIRTTEGVRDQLGT